MPGFFMSGDTQMPSVEELSRKLADERAGLAKYFEDNTKEGETRPTLGADGVKKVQTWNKELRVIADQLKDAQELEAIQDTNADGLKKLHEPRKPVVGADPPGYGDQRPTAIKSIGKMFAESEAYTNRPSAAGATGPEMRLDLGKTYGDAAWAGGIKTVFDTVTSWTLQNIRLPAPITPAEQALTVASLMPEGRTSGNAILYMEEGTHAYGGVAAETAESGSKPEAALVFTEKTANVRKIAVQIPVTDEALSDVPFIESYIDTRLRVFIQQREDAQLLVGDATGVNLRGLLNVVGIQTQAKGADATPTAIYKAMTLIRAVGFLQPSGMAIHPTDWQNIKTLQDTVGNYLWGPPASPLPDGIWGLDVVTTTGITLHTALVGAFRTAAEIFRREDVTMQVGWINDQFIKNQRTILVEERLALVPFRPKGFCTVTGL
jgi:HK97 family phage major capsid protein